MLRITTIGRTIGMTEAFQKVAFENIGHKPVHRAPHGRKLLQHITAGRAIGDLALQRLSLAADAPEPGDGALFVLWRMGHIKTR